MKNVIIHALVSPFVSRGGLTSQIRNTAEMIKLCWSHNIKERDLKVKIPFVARLKTLIRAYFLRSSQPPSNSNNELRCSENVIEKGKTDLIRLPRKIEETTY